MSRKNGEVVESVSHSPMITWRDGFWRLLPGASPNLCFEDNTRGRLEKNKMFLRSIVFFACAQAPERIS